MDDNAVNQKVLGIMLRQAGFEADIVADGEQALAAHQTNPYDLILMDLHMRRWMASRLRAASGCFDKRSR